MSLAVTQDIHPTSCILAKLEELCTAVAKLTDAVTAVLDEFADEADSSDEDDMDEDMPAARRGPWSPAVQRRPPSGTGTNFAARRM